MYLVNEDFVLVRKGDYFTTEEHDSLIIDPSKGLFFWNSRSLFGGPIDYLMKVRELSYYDAINVLLTTPEVSELNDLIKDKRVQKPNIALVQVFHNYGKDYRDYWYIKRGYTDETIDKFKLGFTGKEWVIPLFHEGEFKNFQRRFQYLGRWQVRMFYEGLGRIPFNFDQLPDPKENVYITESPVDAMILCQNGHYAISHNAGAAGWDHEWSAKLLYHENVFIVFDNDDAGLYGARRTSKFLQHNAKIAIWPPRFPDKYDITDLYKSGFTMKELDFYPAHVIRKG